MLGFGTPGQSLGDMDAEAASRLIAAAADATLVVDGDGVIRDMAFGNADLAAALGGRKAWVGRALVDSVAEDSRAKVQEMLAGAAGHEAPRWRHLNLRGMDGVTLPLLCAANQVTGSDRSVVFARDLRLLASLQQRLVEAQQAMEREYGRLRQAETRYRLLFQMSGEPVLVLDAASLRVLEANLAADRLFGAEPSFLDAFAPEERPKIEALLAAVRSAGTAEERRVMLAGTGRERTPALEAMSQAIADELKGRLSRNVGWSIVTPEREPRPGEPLPADVLISMALVQVTPDTVQLRVGLRNLEPGSSFGFRVLSSDRMALPVSPESFRGTMREVYQLLEAIRRTPRGEVWSMDMGRGP